MELILKYFPNIDSGQKEKLGLLKDLYCHWNNKINLISRKDIHELYKHHVLFSLSIAKLISFQSGTSILDAGTGGGFPGIPLSIIFPEVSFTLVDSIAKKIRVVKEICKTLKISNIYCEQERFEKIENQFDFITARAVMPFPKFVKLTSRLIHPENNNILKNGILYLKGGDLNQELKAYKNKAVVYNISEYFDEEFFSTKKIIYLPG